MKMNTEALFLFLILLLGLLFCSILGGNCGREGFEPKNTQLTGLDSPRDSVVYQDDIKFDNYNHFNKTKSELTTGMTFYGPNGGSVVVKTNSDGKQVLEIITTYVDQAEMYEREKSKDIVFYGPNKSMAKVIKNKDGQIAIRVKNKKGTITYNLSGTTPFNPEPLKEYYKLPTEKKAEPEIETPSTIGGLFGGSKGYGTTYFDALPKGIPKSQIPPGQEDLYILKSQVVPPVCPRCPSCPPSKAVNTALEGSGVSLGPGGFTMGSGSGEAKCPPCPACARCPQPDFECKKVPTYNPSNTYLPVPVLSNFSTFGM